MRLQLTRAARAIAMLLPLAATASVARADGDWRLALDTLVYDDTDNVTAVTPRISVRHRLDPEGGSVGAYAAVDAVTAASVDVISHATPSYTESREEVGFDLSKGFDDHLPFVSYRFSIEPDYMSNGGRVGLRSRLGTPDSVLAVSYGLTGDVVGRSGTPWSAFSRELFTHSAEVAFTQTLGPGTLLRGVYGLTVQQGYMEKPYRLVPMFSQSSLDAAQRDGQRIDLSNFDAYRLPGRPPEEVPDLRIGNALGARLLQAIDPIGGSIRVDYQLYLDDWQMTAHAMEVALTGTLVQGLRLVGYGRFYIQTAVWFWRREYVVDDAGTIPRYRSLDRDLSDYHTLTGGARVEWELGDFAGYVDGSVAWTHFDDFIFLEDRVALMGQVGVRWWP